ncbi:hypothetical protein L6452_40454 [Arctium lappa]|uniref:Uncharacterized protein n=1 Tax=Arctium lappa TaxID=4217 RepID=A0ACB8XMQ6_ARCLA|nr:hypothetical protein L6452_40454 [Arctium lappa]
MKLELTHNPHYVLDLPRLLHFNFSYHRNCKRHPFAVTTALYTRISPVEEKNNEKHHGNYISDLMAAIFHGLTFRLP